MRGDIGLLHPLRSADVGLRLCDADERRAHRLNVASAGRHGVEELLRQHLLGDGLLHVDDWRGGRDRDGFLDRPNGQLAVDRRREVRRQLDAFALDRRKPGKRKRDGVGAGTQIEDLVLSLCVSGRGAHLLDERGARDFDGHAGQDGATCVFDDARNRTLCKRCGRSERQPRECDENQLRDWLILHVPCQVEKSMIDLEFCLPASTVDRTITHEARPRRQATRRGERGDVCARHIRYI